MSNSLQHSALDQLNFDDRGLIPAIAQDHASKTVLMMAWMNRHSIEFTLQTGLVHYWSRSRGSLWKKGESSGHMQKLVSLRTDCDKDCILVEVVQTGPACHTNRPDCFYNLYDDASGWRITSEPVA
jgi:phosphoribosyl-AMP cyclohydrolase